MEEKIAAHNSIYTAACRRYCSRNGPTKTKGKEIAKRNENNGYISFSHTHTHRQKNDFGEYHTALEHLKDFENIQRFKGFIKMGNLAREKHLRRKTTFWTMKHNSGHAGLPGNENADLLAKAGASLPTDAIPCPLPTVIAKIRYLQYHNWRRHISHSYLNYQVPKVSSEELLLSRPIRCELSRLRCHGLSLLLSS